jgi:tetratricopeptide (TPR) repeat protein
LDTTASTSDVEVAADTAATADGETHVDAETEADGELPEANLSGAPVVPEEASLSMLDPEVRAELRSLPKNLAEFVGKHLAAAGMLMDEDPEEALRHARYIRNKAARVGLVREAVGLTAYNAGEWAEALSELRAARRMSNGPGHVAVMADCERALGRPERALELAREGASLPLSADEAIELRIVAAGARRDMGQLDAAVVALQGPELDPRRRDPWSARLFYAYADNLAASDRTEEAIRWFLNAAQVDDEGETDAAERAVELSLPADTLETELELGIDGAAAEADTDTTTPETATDESDSAEATDEAEDDEELGAEIALTTVDDKL